MDKGGVGRVVDIPCTGRRTSYAPTRPDMAAETLGGVLAPELIWTRYLDHGIPRRDRQMCQSQVGRERGKR
jgi:hypothetical protein